MDFSTLEGLRGTYSNHAYIILGVAKWDICPSPSLADGLPSIGVRLPFNCFNYKDIACSIAQNPLRFHAISTALQKNLSQFLSGPHPIKYLDNG